MVSFSASSGTELKGAEQRVLKPFKASDAFYLVSKTMLGPIGSWSWCQISRERSPSPSSWQLRQRQGPKRVPRRRTSGRGSVPNVSLIVAPQAGAGPQTRPSLWYLRQVQGPKRVPHRGASGSCRVPKLAVKDGPNVTVEQWSQVAGCENLVVKLAKPKPKCARKGRMFSRHRSLYNSPWSSNPPSLGTNFVGLEICCGIVFLYHLYSARNAPGEG
jgi:hypothetical protein